jgi:hypothetical protein
VKRLLAAAALAAGAVALPATLTGALTDPPTIPALTISPAEGPPGFEFTMSVTGCEGDEPVRFTYVAGSLVFVDTTCDDGTASADLTGPNFAGTFEAGVRVGDPGGEFSFPECEEDPTGTCWVFSEITVLPPSLTASPSSGEPGFEFTMTVENCGAQFFEPESVSTAETGVGQDVVFVLPETGQDEQAFCGQPGGTVTSGTFTAPDEAGEYVVYALFPLPEWDVRAVQQDDMPTPCPEADEPFDCAVFASITVEEPPPVTDPPVTDPPATDPPVTDPPVTDPPATDPPADTAPPTTVDEGAVDPVAPVPELPATGPGASGAASAAIVLVLFGAGLIVVAGSRRTRRT